MKDDSSLVCDLRSIVSRMDIAATFEQAEDCLGKISALLELPLIAWAPNVSRPAFDPVMENFMERQGWPKEITSLWWDRNVMMKASVYIRCRTTNMPFVTDLEDRAEEEPSEIRTIREFMDARGVKSMITTPVHLPMGGIAQITYAGSLPAKETNAIVSQARPELISAALLFTNISRQEIPKVETPEHYSVKLTQREWECLRLSAQGYRTRDIARLQAVKPSTVRFHLNSVAKKLDANTLTNAVAIASQLGMLDSVLE